MHLEIFPWFLYKRCIHFHSFCNLLIGSSSCCLRWIFKFANRFKVTILLAKIIISIIINLKALLGCQHSTWSFSPCWLSCSLFSSCHFQRFLFSTNQNGQNNVQLREKQSKRRRFTRRLLVDMLRWSDREEDRTNMYPFLFRSTRPKNWPQVSHSDLTL